MSTDFWMKENGVCCGCGGSGVHRWTRVWRSVLKWHSGCERHFLLSVCWLHSHPRQQTNGLSSLLRWCIWVCPPVSLCVCVLHRCLDNIRSFVPTSQSYPTSHIIIRPTSRLSFTNPLKRSFVVVFIFRESIQMITPKPVRLSSLFEASSWSISMVELQKSKSSFFVLFFFFLNLNVLVCCDCYVSINVQTVSNIYSNKTISIFIFCLPNFFVGFKQTEKSCHSEMLTWHFVRVYNPEYARVF